MRTATLWRELEELRETRRAQAEEHFIRERELANRYYSPDTEELDIMESELY